MSLKPNLDSSSCGGNTGEGFKFLKRFLATGKRFCSGNRPLECAVQINLNDFEL